MNTMLYPELYKSLESVRWDMEKDIPWDKFDASLLTDEGYPSGPSDIVERLSRYASEHSQVIVADSDGDVLGFIAIHALPRFEQSDRVLRVMARDDHVDVAGGEAAHHGGPCNSPTSICSL